MPEFVLSTHASSWGPESWAWLLFPIAFYFGVVSYLFALGRTDEHRVHRFVFAKISDSLRRATGMPGWSMAGVLSGLMVLLIAVIGLYWDVAWHIDHGRDIVLFTPSHTMIVVGLAGLVYAAVIAVIFATVDEADVGLRAGPLRIPWSALLLGTMGVGGLAGFPIDELWHRAYGIDVTLWSPSHLQMVLGGSLATIALLLMCAEALVSSTTRPNRLGRGIVVLTAATVLTGMTTVQGEFEFGVPQFQVLYLPVLIAVAAGFALVLGRLALGPWGALKVALVSLLLKALVAFGVGGVLEHTTPYFALFVPSALVVEAVAWRLGTSNRLRFALIAGAAIGTVGMVGELAWVGLSGWGTEFMPAPMLARAAVLAPIAAIAAALLGAGLARAFRPGDQSMPVSSLVLGGVLLVAVLAYPLPRQVGDVDATIRLDDPTAERSVVEVELDPPDAADQATAFVVMGWQGGGSEGFALNEVAPGTYRTDGEVAITGEWKSMVSLQRGSEVMAAPIYLPADPEIGASEIPAVAERQEPFVRNTDVLLREATEGPAWPGILAFSGLGGLMALWIGLMAATARRVRPPAAPDRAAPGEAVATGSMRKPQRLP